MCNIQHHNYFSYNIKKSHPLHPHNITQLIRYLFNESNKKNVSISHTHWLSTPKLFWNMFCTCSRYLHIKQNKIYSSNFYLYFHFHSFKINKLNWVIHYALSSIYLYFMDFSWSSCFFYSSLLYPPVSCIRAKCQCFMHMIWFKIK